MPSARVSLTRAFAGAVLFSFPMLMTMEMWWLGFYMDPLKLALYIVLNLPLLFGLSYYVGFKPTSNRVADALDACTAYVVGAIAATVLLGLFGVIQPGMSLDEIIGKIAVQAVPASIGAVLARSQFGDGSATEERRVAGNYAGGIFLMAVGALYLSSSLASTEEMMMISFQVSAVHILALLALSLVLVHGFVVAGMARHPRSASTGATGSIQVFLRFTIVGYAVALSISLFLLWTFGRTAGLPLEHVIPAVVVLGFPAALGAGSARLIL